MKLFPKIFLYSLALSLLPLLVVAFLSHRQIGAQVEADTYRDLESQLVLLRPLAEQALRDPQGAQKALRSMETIARFTIVRADGRVLADSWKDPAAMENHADRPEFVQARRTVFGRASRHSATLGRALLYVARRVEAEGVGGYVRAALPA